MKKYIILFALLLLSLISFSQNRDSTVLEKSFVRGIKILKQELLASDMDSKIVSVVVGKWNVVLKSFLLQMEAKGRETGNPFEKAVTLQKYPKEEIKKGRALLAEMALTGNPDVFMDKLIMLSTVCLNGYQVLK